MKLLTRSISLAVVLSLVLGGPLAPFAAAQQPAQPAAMQDAVNAQLATGSRDACAPGLIRSGQPRLLVPPPGLPRDPGHK